MNEKKGWLACSCCHGNWAGRPGFVSPSSDDFSSLFLSFFLSFAPVWRWSAAGEKSLPAVSLLAAELLFAAAELLLSSELFSSRSAQPPSRRPRAFFFFFFLDFSCCSAGSTASTVNERLSFASLSVAHSHSHSLWWPSLWPHSKYSKALHLHFIIVHYLNYFKHKYISHTVWVM